MIMSCLGHWHVWHFCAQIKKSLRMSHSFQYIVINALSKSGVSLLYTRSNISVIVFQFLGQFCIKKILSGHQCQCQVY